MELLIGWKESVVVIDLLRFEKGANGFRLNFLRVRSRCDGVEPKGSSIDSPGIPGSGLGARLEFRDELRLPCRLAFWESGGVGPPNVDDGLYGSLLNEWTSSELYDSSK